MGAPARPSEHVALQSRQLSFQILTFVRLKKFNNVRHAQVIEMGVGLLPPNWLEDASYHGKQAATRRQAESEISFAKRLEHKSS